MKLSWKSVLPFLGLLCTTAPHARSQLETRPATQSVIGAGAVHVQTGTYILRGTLAQAFIGTHAAGSTVASLGFWHPLARTSGDNSPQAPTAGSGRLELRANPNPFTGSTQLGLAIPYKEQVSLVLYNLLGQPVKTVLNEQEIEGNLNVTLNADDLPSGRYTLILQAGEERQTTSLLLVK